ncbi:hypothetical protein NE237_001580 [Protea cynaroides]|uniref:Borealin C-terminal domain-containing protein n=1 Tax=Protea cynaroides TaxID=273540 RepID=A0A9Q0KTS4_9MAGN|nr:hypothetical protein NE237_001580 [Protea cynaroides]
MGKRNARKNVPKASTTLARNINDAQEEPTAEMQEDALRDHEVECQIAATRAIRDLETERLRTGLRWLRSNFSEEQLRTPVLQFFEENLPNLSVVKNEKDRQFEVEWKRKDGNMSMSQTERNIHAALLQRMSIAYPDFAGLIPNSGAFEFSSKSVKTNLFASANLLIPDFVLEEHSDTYMLGLQNAFRTPGVSSHSHRLSVGMTPKTVRLPKHGEMLLSMRGSPLGVYKEDNNMEVINESENE